MSKQISVWRAIGAVCSAVMAALAILALVYAAGAKLATIESKVDGLAARLALIEQKIAGDHGTAHKGSDGLGSGVAGVAEVGRSVAIAGLPQACTRDSASGEVVLQSDGAHAD